MDSTTILTMIVSGGISLIFSFIAAMAMYLVKRQAQKIDKLEEQQIAYNGSLITLQNTAVSDEHVRRVFREEVAPLSSDIALLLKGMHSVEVFMAEQRGYRQAQQEYLRRKEDQDKN